MKKRPLSTSRLALLPAACLAMCSQADAATVVAGSLINVDFDGTVGLGGQTDPVTFDGDLLQNDPTAASVGFEDNKLEAPDVWNGFGSLNLSDQPLQDSEGTASSLKLSWSGFDFTYTNYLNGRDGTELLEKTAGPNGDGHLLQNAGAARSGTVTLHGLDPAVLYDVITIAGGSDPVTFRIGGESKGIGEWNSVGNPSTWALFSGVVSDGTGNLQITVSTNGRPNFGIGGLQITAVGIAGDQDGDGMPDLWETNNGLNPGNAADGVSALSAVTDPDGDGVVNRIEFDRSTDPQSGDTDEDSLSDGVETKTGIWLSLQNTGTDPLKPDTDGDLLTDAAEIPTEVNGSDPNKKDTDSDGFSDKAELDANTDPGDAASTPRQVAPGILVNYDFNGDENGAAPLPDPILFDGNLKKDASTAVSVALEDADPLLADVWNGSLERDAQTSLEGQPQPTLDSRGQSAPVTIEWSGFAYNYCNYTNGRDGNAFTSGPNGDGFYARTTAQPTVRLAGLAPGKVYQVAALGAGDPAKFTIQDTTLEIGRWNSGTNAANWVLFRDIAADPDGTILLTVSSIDGASNFGIGGVQVAYEASAQEPAVRITAASRNPANGQLTLTWTSRPGRNYTIQWSVDPAVFTTAVSGAVALPGTAGSMTQTFQSPQPGADRMYFRLLEQ